MTRCRPPLRRVGLRRDGYQEDGRRKLEGNGLQHGRMDNREVNSDQPDPCVQGIKMSKAICLFIPGPFTPFHNEAATLSRLTSLIAWLSR